MRPVISWILIFGAAIAAAGENPQVTTTVTTIVRAEAHSIPGSSQGTTQSVAIPARCECVAHDLELIERQPATTFANQNDGVTSYKDRTKRDESGRVTGLSLTVVATVPQNSHGVSEIAVRLSVVVRCDSDVAKAIKEQTETSHASD